MKVFRESLRTMNAALEKSGMVGAKGHGENAALEKSGKGHDEDKAGNDEEDAWCNDEEYEDSGEDEDDERTEDEEDPEDEEAIGRDEGGVGQSEGHGLVSGVLRPGREHVPPDAAKAEGWTVVVCEHDTTLASLTEHVSGETYCVSRRRQRKAMLRLRYDDMLAALHPVRCTCSRNCHKALTLDKVKACRLAVSVLHSEDAVTDHLTTVLRHQEGMAIGGVPVCVTFFAAAFGVCKRKVLRARRLSRRAAGACATRKPRVDDRRSASREVTAYTFWNLFFQAHCQRPNDEVRLFPVNKTMKQIYDDYFLPFARAQSIPADDMPSFSTWKKVRWHDDFKDVKRRPKHFHCRCRTCAALTTRLLEAFEDGDKLARYKRDLRMHDESVKAWRRLEASLKAEAQSPDSDLILLQFDDTNSLGLPNLTHRPEKNLTKTRFHCIPWLLVDHSSRRQDYVYTPKGRFDKGANRLLTMLHAAIRRIKSNYASPLHRRRRLVLIADNAGDNKNTDVLAYLHQLVTEGWFDSVEFLFGEVGHTHNGVDATHKIHNVDVGNLYAGTLGEYVANYRKVWTDNSLRPRASILTSVVDWQEYFKPVLRRLSGMTNHVSDPYYVRGFRFYKNAEGSTDMKWKVDPGLEPRWRGTNGTVDDAGLHLFKHAVDPESRPVELEPNRYLLREDYQRTLLSKAMRGSVAKQNDESAAQYNYDCALHGVIPIAEYVEGEGDVPAGEWGRLARIGSRPSGMGEVRVLSTASLWGPSDHARMWGLPVDPDGRYVHALENKYHFSNDSDLRRLQPLPYVGYQDVPVRERPVYSHPNNIRRRARADSDDENPVVPLQSPASRVEGSDPKDRREYSQPGEWKMDLGEGGEETWFYEVDFSDCKVGHYCVVKLYSEVHACDAIGVQRIDRIVRAEGESKSFMASPLRCGANTWSFKCLQGKWFLPAGGKRKRAEGDKVGVETAAFSVICYFPALTKGKKLIARAVRAVKERGLQWLDVEDLDGDDGQSD